MQNGAALIVMLVIMVIGISSIMIGSLSNAGLKIKRDAKTAEALSQAKDALIGLSVIYNDYPGSLPCPDTDGDGIPNSIGGPPGECPQYIGLLPYKTLGLPDLRDATGERLWYTLSRNVRRYPSVLPLNSDKQGTLNVIGDYTDSNLMAIVFAPGAPVGTQSRSGTQAPCSTLSGNNKEENLCAANYLEGSNDNPSPGSSPNVNYQSSDSSIEFNDQLIAITHDQLFSRVEKRVGGEIKQHLLNYYQIWHAFPFAANSPFANPDLADFTGAASEYYGLYPFGSLIGIGIRPVLPTWNSAPTITFAGGSPSIPMSCIRSVDSRWRCCNVSYGSCTGNNITIPGGTTITITGRLNNVGRGFWDIHDINNTDEVRIKDSFGSTQPASTVFNSPSVTGNLNYTNGSATVTFTGTIKPGGKVLQRIELRDITYESSTLPTWLADNEWHKLIYYATSPGYAPGNNACNPLPGTPSCLSVNGQGGGNDKRAIVIVTGKALLGHSHPSASIADYLEGENSTPSDFIFENQVRSTSFNDQVIVVAP